MTTGRINQVAIDVSETSLQTESKFRSVHQLHVMRIIA